MWVVHKAQGGVFCVWSSWVQGTVVCMCVCIHGAQGGALCVVSSQVEWNGVCVVFTGLRYISHSAVGSALSTPKGC